MPAAHVICHGCDYKGIMQRRSITLLYHLPNGCLVEGYRRFVWCSVCENVTDAEEVINAASIQSEIDALRLNRPSFFVRMVDKALGGGNSDRTEREKLEAKLLLAKLRVSPSRCLRCGNCEVAAIQFDERGTSNIMHSCGHRLFSVAVDIDSPRFSYKSEVITLDVEGRSI